MKHAIINRIVAVIALAAVIAALVFFGLYYTVCFRASDLLNELLANLTAVGDAVRGAAYPLYLLGRMGEGSWLSIALVTAVTLALCALTYLVLSRTFIGIATASGTTAKAEYREKAVKAAGASSALLRKEFGRFTSSPNYMLNCALGTVMLPIMGVLLLVKAGELLPVVYEIAGGETPGFLAVMLCAALCLIGSMNDMTASSVSLFFLFYGLGEIVSKLSAIAENTSGTRRAMHYIRRYIETSDDTEEPSAE